MTSRMTLRIRRAVAAGTCAAVMLTTVSAFDKSTFFFFPRLFPSFTVSRLPEDRAEVEYGFRLFDIIISWFS